MTSELLHDGRGRRLYLTAAEREAFLAAAASGPRVLAAQIRPATAPTALRRLHAAPNGRKLDHRHAASGESRLGFSREAL